MTTTDLATYEPPGSTAVEITRLSTFDVLPMAVELARNVAMTNFVPKDLRGKPEAVVAAILQGHELGLPPMASLNKIHVIDGRPSIAAELMRALVQRSGHEIWLDEASSTRVTIGGRRRGEENPTRITWTIDDAKRARLDQKDNWKKYPRAMLTARATGELCRMIFADVMAGISYTTEEVQDGFTLEDEAAAALEEGTADTLPPRPDDVPPPPAETTTRTARRITRPAAAGATDEGDGQDVDEAKDEPAEAPKGRRAAPPAPPAPEPEIDPTETARPGQKVGEGDHVAGDTVAGPPSSERTYSPAQALAIRAREVGLTEPERKGLIAAYTGGRATSGKDLVHAEIKALFEYLDQIEKGELQKPELDGETWLVRWPDGTTEMASDEAEPASDEALSGAESAPEDETPQPAEEPGTAQEGAEGPESSESEASTVPTVAPEDVPSSEDEWKAFLRKHGIKVAQVLRTAASLAGDPKVAPASLAVLATNPELSAKVVLYVRGEIS